MSVHVVPSTCRTGCQQNPWSQLSFSLCSAFVFTSASLCVREKRSQPASAVRQTDRQADGIKGEMRAARIKICHN